jgi:hypothetical protein
MTLSSGLFRHEDGVSHHTTIFRGNWMFAICINQRQKER